jgi:hypothetical protein
MNKKFSRRRKSTSSKRKTKRRGGFMNMIQPQMQQQQQMQQMRMPPQMQQMQQMRMPPQMQQMQQMQMPPQMQQLQSQLQQKRLQASNIFNNRAVQKNVNNIKSNSKKSLNNSKNLIMHTINGRPLSAAYSGLILTNNMASQAYSLGRLGPNVMKAYRSL